MRILDTNSINYVLGNLRSLHEVYFISPDIKDESELAELVHGKTMPAKIKEISKEPIFDEALYFKYYKEMLNKYGGRSFYNMTGFGDISILALLKTLDHAFKKRPQAQLPGMQEEMLLFTEDQGLRKKIAKEFPIPTNSNLRILSNVKIT